MIALCDLFYIIVNPANVFSASKIQKESEVESKTVQTYITLVQPIIFHIMWKFVHTKIVKLKKYQS